ncbi:MAG: hypothetical protein QNJ71_11085 [Acidimicrobiia bacterium]|nr:hypothetical protein [Acidimicrobiia bacterium]
MLYARTTAAVVALAIAAVITPQAIDAVERPNDARTGIETRTAAPIEPLESVDPIEVIAGVRIISDDADQIEMAQTALEKFERLGWPITNTEIRFEIDGCEHRGYHSFERGHHVVVMCKAWAWTMLHELGHVWSDLYLGDEARRELVERRGLEGWAGDDIAWAARGTEQVAELIAFGLQDGKHIPPHLAAHSDYRTLIEDFEWLFGVPPIHIG